VPAVPAVVLPEQTQPRKAKPKTDQSERLHKYPEKFFNIM
jgi:hypothetical protein